MKSYKIPVSWTVCAVMKVRAANLEEAIKQAENQPLPSEPDYVDGSFEVNKQIIPYENEGLTKAEIKFCGEE